MLPLEAELVAAGALPRQEPPEGIATSTSAPPSTPTPPPPPPSALLTAAQDAFPAYDGAGLFPLVCLMNHSCEPNVEVWFDDGGHNVGAGCRVVAVKNIAAGDELRQGARPGVGGEEREPRTSPQQLTRKAFCVFFYPSHCIGYHHI